MKNPQTSTQPSLPPVNKKGKFIILSGPSCVGKGPLVETLILYFKSVGTKFKKHVLYTSRGMRPGEEDGKTYHFWGKGKQDAEAKKNPQCQTFMVPPDQQMINLETLKGELETYDVVLLEISITNVPKILKACDSFGIPAKQIFVSPLSEDDFQVIGGSFNKKHDREIALRAVMLTKLANRGTETKGKQKTRFDKAPAEMQAAIHNNAKIVCNHFGEDNKRLWKLLQEFVSEPGSLEIAKTFIEFAKEIEQ